MRKSLWVVALAVCVLLPTWAAAAPPPGAISPAIPAVEQTPSLQVFLGSLTGAPAPRAAAEEPTCGPFTCSMTSAEVTRCSRRCGAGAIGLQCCSDCSTFCNCEPFLVAC